jgi:hypothetical protein
VAGPRPSLLELACPSFLSVFVTSAEFGRRKGEKKKNGEMKKQNLCNGATDRWLHSIS